VAGAVVVEGVVQHGAVLLVVHLHGEATRKQTAVILSLAPARMAIFLVLKLRMKLQLQTKLLVA
jgi:hypothetical protein